jgi:transposase
MIVPPTGVRVLVATRPVDFRRGADGLAAIVQTVLRHDPFSGTIYVFRCKRADRVNFSSGTEAAWCCCGNGWRAGRSVGRRSPTA